MPTPLRSIRAISGALLALSTAAGAQTAPVAVRGIAFDGLRNRPLPDARIILVGARQTATSDARGRFHFDSVPPGVHTFAMQHAILDSLGFNGFSTRATITTGKEEVRIALPTFETLWRTACGGTPPEGAGFVFGTIRDADGMGPVANATVQVSWTDMVVEGNSRLRKQLMQRVSRGETTTDSTGSYAICGVASANWLTVRAQAGANESGRLDLAPNGTRIRRRDLVIGRVHAADSASLGTITGMVTDHEGRLFAEARVVLEGGREVRTGDDGRFILRHVTPGTRQIEVMSVGLVPITTAVDVPQRDTATVGLKFTPPLSLDGMKITAARTGRVLADEFTMRRRLATGYTMDSVEVSRFQNLATVFQTFPSLTVEYRRPWFTISMPSAAGRCLPEIRLDGIEAGFGHLADLAPSEVAGLEVYNRAIMVPAQFLRAGHPAECGMILVWTKYGFRNR